eukprot:2807085-Alexandrium_andersonii.AAC.1
MSRCALAPCSRYVRAKHEAHACHLSSVRCKGVHSCHSANCHAWLMAPHMHARTTHPCPVRKAGRRKSVRGGKN